MSKEKTKEKYYGLAVGATLFVDNETGRSIAGNQVLVVSAEQPATASMQSAIQAGGLIEADGPIVEQTPEDKKPEDKKPNDK
ncbi:MAG: hypothetical protein MUC29_03665 [Pyrinomonadaceae bacterium]|jgi:hypothetical protein|nr:hypothetical protein [Pyrinomonadaceae bacterium]